MPEGEEEDQEIENVLEKIMKENFSNLAKELEMEVQEAQRVPKNLDPRKHTPRHIIIKLPKIKDKERIFKKPTSYLFILRERGRQGEREGTKPEFMVACHAPSSENWPTPQACAPARN